MRKNKLITSLTLGAIALCSVGFISCGSKHTEHTYEKVTDNYTYSYKCECGKIRPDGFKIQFVYAADGSEADAGIEVTWSDKNGAVFTAETNDMGYVEAPSLTGSSYKISVNEETLPTIDGLEYQFNGNAFSEQKNGVGFIIPLFAVSEPTATEEISVGENTYTCSSIELDKTYLATISNASQEIWFNLQNGNCGKYTIDATMAGDAALQIDRYYGSVYYINPNPDTKTDKSVKNKLTYIVIFTDAEQNSMFCIKAPNASSYPITVPVSVSITYTPENTNVETETMIKPTHFETQPSTYEYYVTERGTDVTEAIEVDCLAPVAGTPKCEDVEGAVMNNLTEEQFNSIGVRSDGYYYTSANQLVYVKLATPSIFEHLTLASYLAESNPASFAIYRFAEQNEYGYFTRRDNYFGFVQSYVALANSDGLYPLTEEMLDYLNIVAKKEHHGAYEMLCTYPTQANDFARGKGTQSSPYAAALNEQSLGNYNVSIPKGEKVYVRLDGTMDIALTFNSNVKATIDGKAYGDYLSVTNSATIIFETKNGEAQDFILKIAKYDNPYYLEVGDNHVNAIPDGVIEYEFVVAKDGTYDINASIATVVVTTTYGGETYEINGNTITLTLKKGDSLIFEVETSLEMETSFILAVLENTLEIQ